MPKPRVFVSSVMQDFTDCREAARRSIVAAGCEPVMAEDFLVATASPRNACFDGMASSDVCLVIVGNRGGWMAPSGKLVVEEEYEEAKRRHKIVAVYVQNSARDAAAERLVKILSDYVSGHFRATFDDCADLERVLRDKLPAILAPLDLPMTRNDVLDAKLRQPYAVQRETTLRLAIVPERQEEVIDKLMIGTSEFVEDVLAIAHRRNVKLFDYRNAKSNRLERDVLVIEEHSPSRYSGAPAARRIEVSPDGLLVIDAVVSFSSTSIGDIGGMTATFFLLKSDIVAALSAGFSFAAELFDKVDAYKRHQRFHYGVAVTGIGFRSLVEHAEKRSSYSMARNLEEPIVVEADRLIGRDALVEPSAETSRIVTLLERAISS
jgi:hypothetical protein